MRPQQFHRKNPMDNTAPHNPDSAPATIHLEVDMATWMQLRDELRHLHAQLEYLKVLLKVGALRL
jgi:hypothetical protein